MSNTITLPTMLPVKEAAARFGLSPYFLRNLCHTGQVRYIAVSRNKWLVNAERRKHCRILQRHPGGIHPA